MSEKKIEGVGDKEHQEKKSIGENKDIKHHRRGRPTKAEQLGRLRSDSQSPSSAYFKRKRPEKEEQNETETSPTGEPEKFRKIGQSPTSSSKSENEVEKNVQQQETGDMDSAKQLEDLARLITGMREDMKKESEQTRAEIRELKDELIRKGNEWKEEKEEMNRKLENLEVTIEAKDKTINWLVHKEEMRERRERKNNIVIKGWKAPENKDLEAEVTDFLKDRLKVETKVKEARWIKGRQQDKRSVIAELYTWEAKKEVMKKKSSLKITGTPNFQEVIYIDNDMTFSERDVQRAIRGRAEEEKKLGKTVKVGFKKLIVDGKTWKWNEGRGLVKEKEDFRKRPGAGDKDKYQK